MASTWKTARRVRCPAYPDARRTLEHDVCRSRTNGATASPPFHSRTRAVHIPSRYYQDIAVERVMEAIAEDKHAYPAHAGDRHGQDVHRVPDCMEALLQSLESEPRTSRRPRILFLADRNILADQAYNAFSAFPEDAHGANRSGRHPQERQGAEERQSVLHDLPDLHEWPAKGRQALAIFRRVSAGLLRLHRH